MIVLEVILINAKKDLCLLVKHYVNKESALVYSWNLQLAHLNLVSSSNNTLTVRSVHASPSCVINLF